MSNLHATVKPTGTYAITHPMTNNCTQTLSVSKGVSKKLNDDTVLNAAVCIMLGTTIRRACIACLDRVHMGPCTE